MDRDQDEKVSDPEILAYLSKKMRILAIQDE
jgi:hypothetical protein